MKKNLYGNNHEEEPPIEDVIRMLNDEIGDQLSQNRNDNVIVLEVYDCPFSLKTNGFVQIVKFAGMPIWNSEYEDREWRDSHGAPIYTHLKNKAMAHIRNLNNLMMVWKSNDQPTNE